MKDFFYGIVDDDKNLVTLKNGGCGVDSKAIFSDEAQAYAVLVKSGRDELRVRRVGVIMLSEDKND